MKNHGQLKEALERGGYTCIAFNDNGLHYSSHQRGIVPLFELCEKNTAGVPLFVADKVIGKAAALLCVYCRVAVLYADVISESALQVLTEHGIDVQYGKAVEYIKNRDGTGKCPMEALSKGVTNADEMFARILAFVAQSRRPQPE